MAVRVKDGVQFAKIAPLGFEILAAFNTVSDILQRDLTVTGGTDGNHMEGSRHYSGEAYDLRSKDMNAAEKQTLCNYLESTLGPDFLVLLEDTGGVNEHIHVQPRRK
jgi:hypothetical protein